MKILYQTKTTPSQKTTQTMDNLIMILWELMSQMKRVRLNRTFPMGKLRVEWSRHSFYLIFNFFRDKTDTDDHDITDMHGHMHGHHKVRGKRKKSSTFFLTMTYFCSKTNMLVGVRWSFCWFHGSCSRISWCPRTKKFFNTDN
jgi:hypothetical protein